MSSEKLHILFILPNIYEILNGVSKKYINFLEFLHSNPSLSITVFLTQSKKNPKSLPSLPNIQFIPTSGLRVPFYKEIKVPFPSYQDLIQHIHPTNQIIIFHAEFIWLYDSLQKIKKKYPSLHLLPNWHTDYEYYLNHIYQLSSVSYPILTQLQYLLQKKTFSGIIVTGPLMVERFKPFTSFIFNANEIDLSIYQNFKIDDYDSHSLNFIYTGRLSKEKDIELMFPLLSSISNIYHINLHIIGDGPHKEELKKLHQEKYPSLKIRYYGKMDSQQIYQFYHRLQHRIFLFTSSSETFGKSPFEAAVCGIPIFILKSDVSSLLFSHQKNAFIFESKHDFLQSLQTFLQMSDDDKKTFFFHSIQNCYPYDQSKIFQDWLQFLIHHFSSLQPIPSNFLQSLTFQSFTRLIQCSSLFLSENS